MKTFTITISGKSESDIESALDRVHQLVTDGNLSGSDENNTASLSFDSTGEFDPCEAICDTCGYFGSLAEFKGNRKKSLRCPECGSKHIDNLSEEII